jgi:Bacterial type II and III secretion system protein
VFSGQQAKVSLGDELSFLESVNVIEVNGKKVLQPQQAIYDAGLRTTIFPVVSADRRFVKLHYALKLTSVDTNVPLIPVQLADTPDGHLFPVRGTLPAQSGQAEDAPAECLFIQKPRIQTLALDKTVMIPDGGTAVFYLGKILVEEQTEYGPAILSRIPYLNRLFKRTGYGRETRQVFLMVTTRVKAED